MSTIIDELNLDAARSWHLHQENAVETDKFRELVDELRAQEHNLRLNKETVLSLLELMSHRQDLLEKDREFIREIIKELTGDLYDSKREQALVYLALALAGGVIGGVGGACGGQNWGKVAQSIGTTVQRGGDFSNQMFQNAQMWDEVNRSLRQGDHTGTDRVKETTQQQLNRIIETINTQDSTLNRARVR